MIPPKSASIAVKQAFFVGGRLTSASLLSRVTITVYIVDSKTLGPIFLLKPRPLGLSRKIGQLTSKLTKKWLTSV